MGELTLKISSHRTHQGSTHPEDSPVRTGMNKTQAKMALQEWVGLIQAVVERSRG